MATMHSATLCLVLCLCLCFAGKGTVNGFAGTRLLLSPSAASSRKSTAEFMSSEEFYGTAKAKVNGDNSGSDVGTRPAKGRKRRAVRRAVQKVFDTFEDAESLNGNGQYMTDKEKADAVFDRLDTDGDGNLSRTELSSMGLQIGSLNAIDVDRDGTISREEFDSAVEMVGGRLNISGQPGGDAEGIVEELEETLGELEPLERQELRLGGFEPYILVSVLTAQASFEEISGITISWNEVFDTGKNWYSIGVLFSAAGATITGLYATVVFSLTILYGKTALGMDRDDDYYAFMDGTGLQRFRAFQAFTSSLFLFCVSVLLEVTLRCPEFARLPIAAASAAFLYFGKTEYDAIMKAAAPMFAPKKGPAPEKEEIVEQESDYGTYGDSSAELEFVVSEPNRSNERADDCYLEDYDPATGECKTRKEKREENLDT